MKTEIKQRLETAEKALNALHESDTIPEQIADLRQQADASEDVGTASDLLMRAQAMEAIADNITNKAWRELITALRALAEPLNALRAEAMDSLITATEKARDTFTRKAAKLVAVEVAEKLFQHSTDYPLEQIKAVHNLPKLEISQSEHIVWWIQHVDAPKFDAPRGLSDSLFPRTWRADEQGLGALPALIAWIRKEVLQ